MQTILGANGAIGIQLAKSLYEYTDKVRLVSRNPKKINAADELFVADLTSKVQVNDAIRNSEVVYLTAGLKYKLKVWQNEWPLIIDNVIAACLQHHTKFVFFDNVYAYGKVNGMMTEETPYNPCSKKGELRLQIANRIMDETKKGNLNAQIVRAADFYGPYAAQSFMTVMVFENLAKGKAAQWMITDSAKHTFTFTTDAAKATALLGNTESAYNQIWHLPTDNNALTAKEMITLIANEFGVKPNYSVLKRWMLQMIGLFIPPLKENMEMLYQFDSDYLFSSEKFERAFNIVPTTYKKGIEETVAFTKANLAGK